MSTAGRRGVTVGARVPLPRAELGLTLAAGALAAVVWVLWPSAGNYDNALDLVWARELLHGHGPGFTAYAASTPHPGWLAVGVPAVAVLGDQADRALVLLSALSLAALAGGTVRLGRIAVGRVTVAGAAAGVVAGLLTLSSFAFLLLAARGYLDVPFMALVAWAGALAADGAVGRRLRGSRGGYGPTTGHDPARDQDQDQDPVHDQDRGPVRSRWWVAPAVLLALAGLLRPEAWLLGALFWVWCTLRGPWAAADERLPGRATHLALVLLAPAVWAAMDFAVTGDALHSLTATSALADTLGRERGLAAAPRVLVTSLADQARPPVALAAIAGLVVLLAGHRLGLDRVPRRSRVVLLALLLSGVAAFLVAGVAGLSLLPRYLSVPVVLIGVLGAVAATGWVGLPPAGRWRRPWAALVLVAAIVGVGGYLVLKRDSFARLGDELSFAARSRTQVRDLVADPRVTAARRCGPISLPTYRLVPDIRLQLDLGPDRVVARSDPRAGRLGVRRSGVAITVGPGLPSRRYGRADGVPRSTQAAPPGFRPAARRGPFVAWVRCAD